jgi:hypothetical protein
MHASSMHPSIDWLIDRQRDWSIDCNNNLAWTNIYACNRSMWLDGVRILSTLCLCIWMKRRGNKTKVQEWFHLHWFGCLPFSPSFLAWFHYSRRVSCRWGVQFVISLGLVWFRFQKFLWKCHVRYYVRCWKGISDTNKKTNYIACLKTARRIY